VTEQPHIIAAARIGTDDDPGNDSTAQTVETDAPTGNAAIDDSAELTEKSTPDATDADTAAADLEPRDQDRRTGKRRLNWSRMLAYGVLPALALTLAMAAGMLKYLDSSARDNDIAGLESVQAAKDATVALLSYRPDSVEQQLGAARNLLTGNFRDAYMSLTKDVVIPGAKQKQISAQASVPAAAAVTANPNHAVALVFVDQIVIIGTGAPTDTASTVRVTLDKVRGRWLISGFEPV